MYTELKDFPSLGWVKKLTGTRYFSGSIGTGPTGTFTVHTFNYKVWVKEEKDEEGNSSKFLCASCYVMPPAGNGKESFGTKETQYPLTAESLEEAKAWLLKELNSHDCIGQ